MATDLKEQTGVATATTTDDDAIIMKPTPQEAGSQFEVEDYEKEPLLWHSNAPWVGSGYGTQSALFAPLIHRDLGHPVAFSAFFGLKGSRIPWYDAMTETTFTVYPGSQDNHGNDVLGAHYKHYTRGRGWVVLLSDVWVIRAEIARKLPMLAWCPVDHDPVTEMTTKWFKDGGAFPIAMSRFGQDQLLNAGIEHVQYVPHGFDPAVFKPHDRRTARKALGLPLDNFTVGMVAANLGVPSRKCFGQALQAFSIFHKKHPDSTLYLHSVLESPLGENIPKMAATLNIRPYCADPYMLAGLGLPNDAVACVHNALDVLLAPSAGEGFGVPLAEAQACGTPCLTTNFSAMPEVAPVEAGNWTVEGQKIWTGFGSWQVNPSVEELVARLEEAYEEPTADRLARRERVHAHAHAEYSAEHVTETYWKPCLDAARAEFRWHSKRVQVVPVAGR